MEKKKTLFLRIVGALSVVTGILTLFDSGYLFLTNATAGMSGLFGLYPFLYLILCAIEIGAGCSAIAWKGDEKQTRSCQFFSVILIFSALFLFAFSFVAIGAVSVKMNLAINTIENTGIMGSDGIASLRDALDTATGLLGNLFYQRSLRLTIDAILYFAAFRIAVKEEYYYEQGKNIFLLIVGILCLIVGLVFSFLYSGANLIQWRPFIRVSILYAAGLIGIGNYNDLEKRPLCIGVGVFAIVFALFSGIYNIASGGSFGGVLPFVFPVLFTIAAPFYKKTYGYY